MTFAAGLAAGGLKPVVAVYSSFLQRAYDQILHDVCIQNLPVVFAIDRAGLVGSDGETHQGIFDLYVIYPCIPNMHIMCAEKQVGAFRYDEVCARTAKRTDCNPVSPRRSAYDGLEGVSCAGCPRKWARVRCCQKKYEIALFAVGSMVKTAEEVQEGN